MKFLKRYKCVKCGWAGVCKREPKKCPACKCKLKDIYGKGSVRFYEHALIIN